MKIARPFLWRGRWYMKVRLPNGKRSQRWVADTEEKADAIWKRMRDGAEKIKQGDTDAVTTLRDLISVFVKDQIAKRDRGELSAGTVNWRMLRLSRAMTDETLRSISVQDLKPYHVSDWLDTEKRWGATMRADAVATLKQVLRWSKGQGRIKENPLELMSEKRGDPREFVVSDELFGALLDGVGPQKRSRSLQIMLRMLSWTGARPGELCRAEIEDYRDGAVDESGRRLPGSILIREHKTKKRTRRARVIYLSPCADALARASIGNRVSGPIFRPNGAERWLYVNLRRRFDRLRAKVESPKECVLYSFRHTRITHDLLNGMEPAVVATIHGTSLKMIEKVYGHLSHHRDALLMARVKADQQQAVKKYRDTG